MNQYKLSLYTKCLNTYGNNFISFIKLFTFNSIAIITFGNKISQNYDHANSIRNRENG